MAVYGKLHIARKYLRFICYIIANLWIKQNSNCLITSTHYFINQQLLKGLK